MKGKKILVLGGGVGGLTAAHHLRAALPLEHSIVVVEKDSTFYLCPLNMRIISGTMKHPQEGERELSRLESKGIEWIQGEILKIDPEQKMARTTAGTLMSGDYMVIALGGEKRPDIVPNFFQTAHNFYDAQGALGLRQRLENFEGGRIVVLICSTIFPCLATPYEAALLIDSFFRQKGIREKVEIAIYTPETQPVPLGGASMGEAICGVIAGRDVEYHPLHELKSINPDTHRLVFKQDETYFDLLVGVPPYLAPQVVKKAGLTDKTGWIPVNLQTLETKYAGVYAIGDVTSLRQPNPTGWFLPKNWIIVEEQARVVAKNIAAEILGRGERSTFKGRSFCFMGVGDGEALYADANFYGYPEPVVYLEPASKRSFDEREKLEQELMATLVPENKEVVV